MMISKQLRNLLVQRGALERLRELNQELRVLATVFPVGRPRRLHTKQPRKVKQLHWTQRPPIVPFTFS